MILALIFLLHFHACHSVPVVLNIAITWPLKAVKPPLVNYKAKLL